MGKTHRRRIVETPSGVMGVPASSRLKRQATIRGALMEDPNLERNAFWQTRCRGDNDSEYQIYLACADDGEGNDFTMGKPLKTYEEWLNS